MEFILDNNEAEEQYKHLIRSIKSRQNGDVSALMRQKGIEYKMNWGVSLVELRTMAKMMGNDHLLALKLWNKQWRETMILATLIDEPALVTEEQMDFWTRSFTNNEIAEQASANLWVKTKFAFVKSLEWCRGKKHWVRFSGIHLMGRLAIVEKSAIDEMFDPFFEELPALAKDSRLNTVLYRALIAIGSRSKYLHHQTVELTKNFRESNSENAVNLGEELLKELTSPYLKELVEGKQ
ncbi:MAG: hypothetical protein J7L95_02785 [Prolixibacteraceae bacterium]|nr:hypothetical protein [Prolixibacteraceae bacterium]